MLSSSLPGLSVVVAIALATSLNTLMMVMGAGIALLVVVGGCGAMSTSAVAGGTIKKCQIYFLPGNQNENNKTARNVAIRQMNAGGERVD